MKAREVLMNNLGLCMEEQLEKLLKIKSVYEWKNNYRSNSLLKQLVLKKKYSKKKKDLHMFFIN